jgi:hypothetical protein
MVWGDGFVAHIVVKNNVREHGLEVKFSHILVKTDDGAEEEPTLIIPVDLHSRHREPWISPPLWNEYVLPHSLEALASVNRFACWPLR